MLDTMQQGAADSPRAEATFTCAVDMRNFGRRRLRAIAECLATSAVAALGAWWMPGELFSWVLAGIAALLFCVGVWDAATTESSRRKLASQALLLRENVVEQVGVGRVERSWVREVRIDRNQEGAVEQVVLVGSYGIEFVFDGFLDMERLASHVRDWGMRDA